MSHIFPEKIGVFVIPKINEVAQYSHQTKSVTLAAQSQERCLHSSTTTWNGIHAILSTDNRWIMRYDYSLTRRATSVKRGVYS